MFEKGKVYKRNDLHDKYGGNRQGGIALSAHHPFICIFSGTSGESYGYEVGWDEEAFFLYTGDCQLGDMTFTKGNRAILDHVLNKNTIYLVMSFGKDYWKYVNEFELVDYEHSSMPNSIL